MFQITARRDLRDHPRTRGEKCSYPADRHSVPGSPPHTRGKVHPAEAEHRRSRITPAHAGKSSASCGLRSLTRDHPRTRGEKPLVQGHSFLLLGSPPHTRGKGSKTLQDRRLRRITPAHAGKRAFRRTAMNRNRDHPRTRGEKPVLNGMEGEKVGSPPHTRGKVFLNNRDSLAERITPAHAGKSRRGHTRRRENRDHPRTRGEKTFAAPAVPALSGSPPHTRGKDCSTVSGSYLYGITPAHAGKRQLHLSRHHVPLDHPRTRGEKSSMVLKTCPFAGSPPHTRGKDGISEPLHHCCGITPAHAGKRLSYCLRGGDLWDHPRTRGEKYLYRKLG